MAHRASCSVRFVPCLTIVFRDETTGWHHHGLDFRLGDDARRGRGTRQARGPLRDEGRLRPPHARPAVRIRVHGAEPRHRSHRRRSRRRGPSTRHGRLQDHVAGARRSGAVEGAQRPRFAAVHRADARGNSRGHVRHRRGGRHQCGPRGGRHPREQASGNRRGTQEIPCRADRQGSRAPGPSRSRCDHRNRRRRTARAHDGPRGLSTGPRLPVSRQGRADARAARSARCSRAPSPIATC